MASSVYSTIEEKGFVNGVAFIMTTNGSVMEAHIYNSIIIYFKSLRLSFEQMCGVLSGGDIKQMTFQKSEIKPETVQPQIIMHTLPGAVSASAFSPAQTSLA